MTFLFAENPPRPLRRPTLPQAGGWLGAPNVLTGLIHFASSQLQHSNTATHNTQLQHSNSQLRDDSNFKTLNPTSCSGTVVQLFALCFSLPTDFQSIADERS